MRPANEPEHAVLALLTRAVTQHGVLGELLIDRGYLGSPAIATLHADGVAIRAKAWTSTDGARLPKHAFTIDFAAARVVCPAPQAAAIRPGTATVQFPTAISAVRASGRVHHRPPRRPLDRAPPRKKACCRPCAAQRDPHGRAQLRERTTVEHTPARVQQIQRHKARYKGLPQNTLDVRRVATVVNLQRIARLPVAA